MSVKCLCNTFDLNLKWGRTLPSEILHGIFIEPPPPSILFYRSWHLTPWCGLEVQKPTQALKSVKNMGNTFGLNIARNDRWFAHLHTQNGGQKGIWILAYSWTGNFLLAWARQFAGIKKSSYATVWTISQNITGVPWKLKVPTEFQIWSVSAIQKHWEEVKKCILHGF